MYIYSCKVLNIVDGDTIDIELDLGFNIKMKERVRLLDVDTPEIFGRNAVPSGQVASDFTKLWIEERRSRGIFVYESKKYNARDKYGRSLGYLKWLGTDGQKETLNEALIASGNVKNT
jgi:micrococcal nuclease